MTQGEKVAHLARQLLRPWFLGFLFAVWGALIYTGGPASALFSGEWQANLAGKGWGMTAFFLLMTVGGILAPFFAIWHFHKGLQCIKAIRSDGLSAWLSKQDGALQAEVRRRSEERTKLQRK